MNWSALVVAALLLGLFLGSAITFTVTVVAGAAEKGRLKFIWRKWVKGECRRFCILCKNSQTCREFFHSWEKEQDQ